MARTKFTPYPHSHWLWGFQLYCDQLFGTCSPLRLRQ